MRKIFLSILFSFFILFIAPLSVFAYQYQDIPDTKVEDDFVLGPGKTDFWLNPGEKASMELFITNRLGRVADFEIDIEDFKGSHNPEESIVLLGEEKGPYSLKDYLKPELLKFTLTHGQRLILPVFVSIPKDAEPGGRYGAVLVKTTRFPIGVEVEKEKVTPETKIISRLGSLLFVRVKGAVVEKGFLKELKIVEPKKLLNLFYEKGPIKFELIFKNEGTVHLIPYGTFEITNLLGKKVGQIEVDPFYVLPDATRGRKIEWSKKWLFGRYTASASINRGYQDIIDQKTLIFWVIPWRIILIGLFALAFLIWVIKWLARHLEIKVRRK